MNRTKKQSFIHGAMILAAAGIIVKVIGAFFKIPLGAILKPEGMANFSIAYNIYALLFVLSTAGVPVAVSKMIAEANAMGKFGEVRRIYRVSSLAFITVGAFATLLMYFGADLFAKLMGSVESASAIRAIAPAVFFVSISSINRGYYQGHSNMYPTAFSEVIEALGKLIIGLGAAWWLSANGFGTQVVSAGAVLGVSVGTCFGALYFMRIKKREVQERIPAYRASHRRKRDILSELLKLAIPITVGAAVISLTNVIDSALVMNLLQKIGYTVHESMWLYGAYNYSANLFNLPSVLVTTIGVSLIPAISAAFVRHDIEQLNKTMESAMRIAMLVAFSAAAGMFVLGYPIIYLLYGGSIESEAVAASGVMLSLFALAVPFLAVVSLTNAIHQSLGNVKLPVISMAVGAGVKLLSNWVLVSIPGININGACVSTMLCYFVIASINLIALMRVPHIKLNLFQMFGKPALVGIATGAGAQAVYRISVNQFGIKGSTVLAVFAGMLVCAMIAYVIKAITLEDLSVISRKNNHQIFEK